MSRAARSARSVLPLGSVAIRPADSLAAQSKANASSFEAESRPSNPKA